MFGFGYNRRSKERFHYNWKNKKVNRLVRRIFIGWILLLGYLAFLGSHGVVFHIP